MKLRCDFVTNSSSSSFIISRDKNCGTKDILFNILKGFYREYYALKDKFMPVCDKYKVHWDDEHHCFKHNEGYKDHDEYMAINSAMEKDFGFSTWDYFDYDISWLDCATYDDYVAYCVSEFEKYKLLKEEDKDKKNTRAFRNAPFYIVDYTNDKTYVDLIAGCSTVEVAGSYGAEDLLDWYVSCADALFEGKKRCRETCNSDFCCYKENPEDCQKFLEAVATGKVVKSTSTVDWMGDICIHSESGYIPDYVVNKIGDLCSFACNHMG